MERQQVGTDLMNETICSNEAHFYFDNLVNREIVAFKV